MRGEDRTDSENERETFVVSDEPVVQRQTAHESAAETSNDFENLGELPRSYDQPLLVAIARDPHTLFAYWDIDWPTALRDAPPKGQTVYIRLIDQDGAEVSLIAIEPLAGSQYVNVAATDSSYRLELGYYDAVGEWRSLARSDAVITPRDTVTENGDFQLATIPLHLKFQQIVDALRGSRFDARALASAIGELQQVIENAGETGLLAHEEAQLLDAIGWSFTETEAANRAEMRDQTIQAGAARARLRRILGIGPSVSSGSGVNGGGS